MPLALSDVQAEWSAGSKSAIERSREGEASEVHWRYELAPGVAAGQFAALQIPIAQGLSGVARVRLRLRSEQPARIWLQLRAPGARDDRWGSTFYVEGINREIDVPLSALDPLGVGAAPRPPLDAVTALLLVVDTLNSRPGASGRITVSEVALVR